MKSSILIEDVQAQSIIETVDGCLDREKIDTLELQVRVTDVFTQVIGKESESIKITLKIADLDDTPPEFFKKESWKFEVDENEFIFISQIISVTDSDENQEFFFDFCCCQQ